MMRRGSVAYSTVVRLRTGVLIALTLCVCMSQTEGGQRFNPFTGRPDYCSSVSESDGSPANNGCQNLLVSNGSLTDNGDGTFSLTTGSGDITSVADCASGDCPLASTTFGSGSGFTWTLNAGATDPTLTFGSDSTTLNTDLTFENGEFISNNTDTIFTFGSNNNNERLSLDIDESNGMFWSTTTGLGVMQFTNMDLALSGTGLNIRMSTDNGQFRMGASTDATMEWDTNQTNDGFFINTGKGSAAQSGNIVFGNSGSTNYGLATSANQKLYVVSADTGTLTDWISFYHDQTNPRIDTGNGDLLMNNDLVLEDTSPHLEWRDTSTNLAYQIHVDNAASPSWAQWGLWRGTDAGNSAFAVAGSNPVMAFDSADALYLPSLKNCDTITMSNLGKVSCVSILHLGNNDETAPYTASPFTQSKLELNGDLWIRQAGDYQVINVARSSGSLNAPTLVANDDRIGATEAWGYDGSTFVQAARFLFEIDGSPGVGDMPGRIEFWTTPDGADSGVPRVQIDSAGHMEFLDTVPAVSSCGAGSPTVNANSTDHSGSVTVGTGASVTSCTITFSAPAFTNAPNCVAQDTTALLLIRATASTTTVVFDAATTFDADVLNWICFSNE